MSTRAIPPNEWAQFLPAFTRKHAGWLVTIETHDLETGETVESRLMQLQGIELDLEDSKNPRINIVVRDGDKEFKHILFRPSDLTDQISSEGNEQGLRVTSVHTVTTLRFRVATAPELVDGV